MSGRFTDIDDGIARSGWPVHIALALASLIYCLPLFSNFDCYGRRDWDQFMFRYETPRLALLRDHQMPLWNPYVNGGTVLLAHPQCPAASPWYLVVLTLGAPLGLRIQVLLFMTLGSTGMAALLRLQHVPSSGCFVGGVVFMMSSHFVLHIAEGHLEWCVLGLMPWLAVCLHRRQADLRMVIVGALLLSSVLTFGSVYIVAVYVPFLTLWAALESVKRRSARCVTAWCAVLVTAFLLSAVKLVPQLEFTGPHPRETEAEGFAPRGLPIVFFDARQAKLYQSTRDVFNPPQYSSLRRVPDVQAVPIHKHLQRLGFQWVWHEYGCYVTYLGLALAACGMIASWRHQWPLYIAGVLALLTVPGNGAPVDLWSWLQQLPLYSSLHVPSRFLAAVVFVLAVAAGHGLGWATRRVIRTERPLLVLLVRYGVPLAIWLELLMLGRVLFSDIFVICTAGARTTMGAGTARNRDFATRVQVASQHFPVMTSCIYPQMMNNNGVLYGYENITVGKGEVRVTGDPNYRGEVWLQDLTGETAIRDWTMARVKVAVDVDTAQPLVLNQNYSGGWQVTISGSNGVRSLGARPTRAGLVSTTVRPGDQTVEFDYFPQSFVWGSAVSGTTLVACLLLLMAGSPVIRSKVPCRAGFSEAGSLATALLRQSKQP